MKIIPQFPGGIFFIRKPKPLALLSIVDSSNGNNHSSFLRFAILSKMLTTCLILFTFTNSLVGQVNLTSSPSAVSVNEGDTFTIIIALEAAGSEVTNGVSVYLNFDSSIIEVNTVTALGTSQLPVEIPGPPTYDNNTGTLSYSSGTFSNFPEASFDYLEIEFVGLAVGNTNIDFNDILPLQTEVTDENSQSILNKPVSSVPVEVTNITNVEPEISLAETTSVNEGESLQLPLTVSDDDGDDLTVTITSVSNEPQELQSNNEAGEVPPGIQREPYPIDASGFFTETGIASSAGSYSSTLNFDPTYGDGGSNGDGNGVYTITVEVSDANGNSVSKTLDVTVNDVDQNISSLMATRIEAESYDDQGNTGGGDGIGIEEAGTGFILGFTTAGDFTEYNINVTEAGTYQMDFFVARQPTGAKSMLITTSAGSETLVVDDTGTWSDYDTVSVLVPFDAGSQTLRFDWNDGGGFYMNIDYFDMTLVPDAPPTVSITSPNDGDDFLEGSTVNVTVEATDDVAVTQVELFNDGVNSLGTDSDFPYEFPLDLVAGTYNLTAVASDGNSTTTSSQITITISTTIDTPPTIDAIANVAVEEGSTINFNVQINDDIDPSSSIEIFDKSVLGTSSVNPIVFTPGATVSGLTYSDNGGGSYTLDWDTSTYTGDGKSFEARVTANDGINPPVVEIFSIDLAQNITDDPILARTFSNPLPWYGAGPQAPFTVAIEDTGAKNIGYIEAGEFVEYVINVPTPGVYEATFYAGKGNGGTLTTTLSVDGITVGSFGATENGWQEYEIAPSPYTFNAIFNNAGIQTLRLDFSGSGGVNIKDFEFVVSTSNTPPLVNITSPLEGAAVEEGTVILTGTASDFEDSGLTAGDISWSSDIQGPLGNGASISPSLYAGTHVITASVTDSGAETSTVSITVVVQPSAGICDLLFRVNVGGAGVSGWDDNDAGATATFLTAGGTNLFNNSGNNGHKPIMPTPLLPFGTPLELFETERWDSTGSGDPDEMLWQFPVAEGTEVEVTLYFAEIYGPLNSAGLRVFDVTLEGIVPAAFDDIDPFAIGGGGGKAFALSATTTVVGGTLDIKFLHGIIDNPNIKAIQVCKVADPPNNPPQFVAFLSPGDGTVARDCEGDGEMFDFNANFDDLEDDDSTLNIEWFSGTTSLGFGAPLQNISLEVGTHSITAVATDSDGASTPSSVSMDIEVIGAPIFTVTENTIGGSPLLDAEIEGPDVTVCWSVENLDAGGSSGEHFHLRLDDSDNGQGTGGSVHGQPYVRIDDQTGCFTFTNVAPGEHTISVHGAETGHNQICDATEVTFTILAPNQPPLISSAATASVEENQTGAIDVNATDDSDDEGSGLIFSKTGGADQALFDLDVNTGVLTFIGAPDFEIPGDDNGDNDYEVQVTVTDLGSLTDVQDITITVTDVFENTGPMITSAATASVDENQTAAINVESTDDVDEEGSGLLYSKSGGADLALFNLDSSTGVLTFINAPDFEIPGDDNGDNDYEVQVTVMDSGGLTDVQNIVISVNDLDDTPPTALCIGDYSLTVDLNTDGNASITAADIDAGSSDAGGIASISVSPSTFTCADFGEQIVTLTVTDNSGNIATCSAIILVNDTLAPSITCPPNVNRISSGAVMLTDLDIGTPVVADNCGVASVVGTRLDINSTDLTTAPYLGITIIQWVVTDTNGVVNMCNQNITVSPPPTVSVPSVVNKTQAMAESDIITANLVVGAVTTVNSDTIAAGDVISQNPAGGASVEENSPVDLVVSLGPLCEVNIDNQPLSLSVCEGSTNFAFSVQASGNGILSYNWQIFDTFSEVWVDFPTFNGNASLNFDGPIGLSANGNQYRVIVTSDNSTGDNTDDDCSVISDEVLLTVNPLPIVAFTALADVFIDAGVQTGLGGGTPPQGSEVGDNGVYSGPGVTDDGNGMTYSFEPAIAGVGTHTIIYTYTNANGCTDSASDDVVVMQVIDNPPTIDCPEDITVNVDPEQCGAIVVYTAPVGVDDMDGAITGLTAGHGSGALFPVGVSTETYMVTDSNGQTSSCSFTITVIDNINPVATCPDNIFVSNDPGECGAIVEFNLSVSDNCPGATISSDFLSGSLFPIGTTSVTATAIDATGNTDTCTFNIEVEDTEAPEVVCTDFTIQLDANGNGSIEVSDIDNGSSDNCGISSIDLDTTVFTTSDIGENGVVLTVVDNNGNSNTCEATVTVEPYVPSVLSITEFMLVNADSEQDIMIIADGEIIDINSLPTENLNIRAETTNDVESVFFELSGTQNSTRNENVAPYALFGDASGNYKSNDFSLGSYDLVATPYSENGKKGIQGTSLAINFVFTLGNVSPIAVANGVVDETIAYKINFFSTGSYDPDGNIVSYEWDFGDGNTSNAENPMHTYAAEGEYSVTLTVNDNEGGEDITSIDVLAQEIPVNMMPVAIADGTADGIISYKVNFSSSESYDPDGNIVSYEWDFGDGNMSNEENPMHTYASGGDYYVTLTVTDDDGEEGFTSIEVSAEEIPNVPPVAVADAGTPNEFVVDFLGSESDDPDGNIVSYEWDFGDGNTSTDINPTHTYTDEGVYLVTLTVIDDDGADGTAAIQVNIVEDSDIQKVVALTLINADTDTGIIELTNNMLLDEASLEGIGLNIGATTNPEIVGSVFFQLTGPLENKRKESGAPYALFGDFKGNYFARTFPAGDYTITATPYSLAGAKGEEGQSLTINFTIAPTVAPLVANALKIYPNPASESATMDFEVPTQVQEFLIFDITGKLVKRVEIDVSDDNYQLSVYDLPVGTYHVRTTDVNGVVFREQMVVKK
ncbi:PKD domain-containing protein [Flagellimonas eckloniae]|uniref:Uncharacterized protein n=1 Tax=Flagellimonas eckloniae TaxID=346185 RepID=A0A0Q1DKM1_9FLAO|nr:PKD domain-containing protein [Allomuricauda eckloniae]KQC29410.1 hypothetical protein AAY42_05510 [Allomuricauda eckloniae]